MHTGIRVRATRITKPGLVIALIRTIEERSHAVSDHRWTYNPLHRRQRSLVMRNASPSSDRVPETSPPSIRRDAGI
jgi:hypothetical protein